MITNDIGRNFWFFLQYKPLIRWIWLGALLIGLGAFTTVFDRRYRARVSSREVDSRSAKQAGTMVGYGSV